MRSLPAAALAAAVLLVPVYAFDAAQVGSRGAAAQTVAASDAYLATHSLGPSPEQAVRLSLLNGFTSAVATVGHGYALDTTLHVTAGILHDPAQRFALTAFAATLAPGQELILRVEDVPLVEGEAPDGEGDRHGHDNSQGGGHAYAYGHCKPGHDNHPEECDPVLACQRFALILRLDALVLGPDGARVGEFVTDVTVHLWAGALC